MENPLRWFVGVPKFHGWLLSNDCQYCCLSCFLPSFLDIIDDHSWFLCQSLNNVQYLWIIDDAYDGHSFLKCQSFAHGTIHEMCIRSTGAACTLPSDRILFQLFQRKIGRGLEQSHNWALVMGPSQMQQVPLLQFALVWSFDPINGGKEGSSFCWWNVML